jgi:trimeric autotransporter adhesin
MASQYSALKIQLMATGENSGTWGNVTNDNLGVAIEEAIAESADVTFSGSNVSITLSDTNASQEARNLRLNLTGTSVASTQALTVPDIEKPYIVNNGLTDDVEVKNSTGANVTVPAGKTMWVYSTGAGVVDAMNAGENLTGLNATNVSSGTLSNARTTASSSNSASTIVARDASGNFASNQITGVNVNASSQVTAVGFMRGKFSDDVVALGSTGAATTINLAAGTVFTATLTDNCTFTFANPNGTASTGSSFTLILTNDATPSRSIVWPGSVAFSDGTVPARTTAATAKIFGSFLPRMAGPSTTAPSQSKTSLYLKGVFKWQLPLNNKPN